MSLLEDVVNSPNDEAEVKKEIHNYLCLDVAVGNPLIWWHQMRNSSQHYHIW